MGPLLRELKGLIQFFMVLILMITGLGTKLVREPKPRLHKQRKDLLILSHYVGSHARYGQDPFLGEVAQSFREDFSNITFFLNSTQENSRLIESTIKRSFNHDFLINSKKVNILKFLKILRMLLMDLAKFTKLARLLYPTARFTKMYQVFISSTSISTLSILSAWNNFENALVEHGARFVLMPSEGNSHELFFLDQIKRHHPHVRVLMYQHAPLVADQPGFFQVVEDLREKDLLLLSSSGSRLMIEEKVPLDRLKCPIRVVGSSRASNNKMTKNGRVVVDIKTSRNVLFLPEGTNCAVDELVKVCNSLARIDPSAKIRIRFHPDYKSNSQIQGIESQTLQSEWISSDDLMSDLSWADEVWFRASSAIDAALHLGLLSVHVNLNSGVDLNPIRFLGHPYLEVKTLNDIKNLHSRNSRITASSTTANRKSFLFEEVDAAELHEIYRILRNS